MTPVLVQWLLANKDEDAGILVNDGLALHGSNFAAGKKPDNRHIGQVLVDIRRVDIGNPVEPAATSDTVEIETKRRAAMLPALVLRFQLAFQIGPCAVPVA